MARKQNSFTGFPQELVVFLRDLARHNNRTWFMANRERYETYVRGPALEFIAAMASPLAKISPHFLALPKKVGGSLMRIHRDVRFSKDKQPYKTNVGIQFRHSAGVDVHAPGFYFHIDPRDVFLGAGVWHPDSPSLAHIRQAIDEDPAAWRKASTGGNFVSRFELSGESLKRPPRGYGAEHPQIVDLMRKDHIAICRLDHEAICEPEIVAHTIEAYRTTKPYVSFLCKSLGVKF